MNEDGQKRLLEDLNSLLLEQVVVARNGNYRRLEALTQQAGPIVDNLRKSGAFENTAFAPQCRNINNLYKKLELAVAGEKIAVEIQQRKVAGNKKTLRAYLNS